MRWGGRVAAVFGTIGSAVLMVAFIDSIFTCSQVSDLGCGPGHISYGPMNDGLLFIAGVFLLGIGAVIALDSWKLQVKTKPTREAESGPIVLSGFSRGRFVPWDPSGPRTR